MSSQEPRKLTLSKETLRTLTDEQLGNVAGGHGCGHGNGRGNGHGASGGCISGVCTEGCIVSDQCSGVCVISSGVCI